MVVEPRCHKGNRGNDVDDKAKEARVNALLAERKGYAARGMDERVNGVDKELKALGYRELTSSDRADARDTMPSAEKAVK